MRYVLDEMTHVVQDMDHLVDTAQVKLHIGSGPVALSGWTNVDVVPYDGVHVLSDVRHGLPFANVEFIFAEHFLEPTAGGTPPARRLSGRRLAARTLSSGALYLRRTAKEKTNEA